MEHETFLSLLHSSAHWEFEVFLTLLQDVLIGALLWPALKRRFRKEHQQFDKEHGIKHQGAACEACRLVGAHTWACTKRRASHD